MCQARHAEAAGAVALIIVNSDEGRVTAGGADPAHLARPCQPSFFLPSLSSIPLPPPLPASLLVLCPLRPKTVLGLQSLSIAGSLLKVAAVCVRAGEAEGVTIPVLTIRRADGEHLLSGNAKNVSIAYGRDPAAPPLPEDPCVPAPVVCCPFVCGFSWTEARKVGRDCRESGTPPNALPELPAGAERVTAVRVHRARPPTLVIGADDDMVWEQYWPAWEAGAALTEKWLYTFQGYSFIYGGYWRPVSADEAATGGSGQARSPVSSLTERGLQANAPLWLASQLVCEQLPRPPPVPQAGEASGEDAASSSWLTRTFSLSDLLPKKRALRPLAKWIAAALQRAYYSLHETMVWPVTGPGPAAKGGQPDIEPDSSGDCIAFRQTGDCSSTGLRQPHGDKSCATTVPCVVGSCPSGYCECRDGLIKGNVTCTAGQHSAFTCSDVCTGRPPASAPLLAGATSATNSTVEHNASIKQAFSTSVFNKANVEAFKAQMGEWANDSGNASGNASGHASENASAPWPDCFGVVLVGRFEKSDCQLGWDTVKQEQGLPAADSWCAIMSTRNGCTTREDFKAFGAVL